MTARSPVLVVMAGGSGTRFWPKSTSARPKQLLDFGGSTLLQQTFARFEGMVAPERQWVVTTARLADAIQEDSPHVRVLAEPQGRNTAPCVYWAAREVARLDPQAVMLVMPADHHIARPRDFQATLAQAIAWAESHDDLVTLGITPTRAETGYGYLETAAGSAQATAVTRFVEKPNLARAEEFLASGRYLWNGGMFVWRASVILRAFDQALPEYGKIWEESGGNLEAAYPRLAATSIDFGVMEKVKNVVTFPLQCGWDDLGSWTSLEDVADVLHARREGGVVTGGELIAVESKGNIVDVPGRVVTILGVDDLIVVEKGGALLVARKDRAQDIRLVVEAIKKKHPELA